MSQLLESLLTPQQRQQAAAADAAFQALRTAQAAHPRFAATHRARDAERAVFRAATQAIDASQRPAYQALRAFDADFGSYTGHPMDPRSDSSDDSLTSLQPLGDAQVLVCYSSDGADLSIDGAMIHGEFVDIDCFTSIVRGQWYRAIRAEEAKNAEIAGWDE